MEWISLVLLATGAVGSITFVADYLRTADLELPYTRLMITMNVAIGGVLTVATLARLDVIQVSSFWQWIYFALFAIVDITIWYQMFLLYRIRRAEKKVFRKEKKRIKRKDLKDLG